MTSRTVVSARQPLDTSSRILVACERVIARGGLSRFRLQDVAREAGVSIGLLAYHFGGRAGLLQAALDHIAANGERRSHSLSTLTPILRLRAMLHAEFNDDAEVREGSITWNEIRANAVFDASNARALARSTESWQRAVESLVSAATPDNPTPQRTALLLTSLVEGLSGRWLTSQIDINTARATIDDALESVLGVAEFASPNESQTRSSL